MATSNRDRIDRMFQVMAPALDDYIASVIGQGDQALGAVWTKLVEAKDAKKGITGKTYDPLDPQVQFRMLTESNITAGFKSGWYPFNDTLGRAGEAFASELKGTRDSWAHAGTFSDDDAYRALDTGERLLRLVAATAAADQVRAIRLNLRRVTADKADKQVLKAAVDNPEAAGLRPWRDVLPPHEDVATGNFHASEFAADLYKVATGGEEDSDYANPVEFFKRTYLTEGLRDLIGRAVRRLAGDDNATPVMNLQTNFGGGKTHSMLALWHVAAGRPLGDFPQDTQELLLASGYTGQPVNRVALVGNHLSPSGITKPDGTVVNTMWGELAWQLGGADAYAIVAQSDHDRTPPGQALHQLLAAYAPAVILIDEWVAYARSLVGRDDLAGGTFDDQFTFAQALTEAAKGTSGVLLAISIPASETGDAALIAAGSAEEVGGANGLDALKRLQNVVRRVADQWRPASANEAYHIVKQRLFTQPDAAALAAINATARGFVDLYRKYPDDFPRESREVAYEDRIKQTYPIHPELFDTLYEQWSSLERFQRTRGVLRLMTHGHPRPVGGRGRLAADHAGLDPAGHREREQRTHPVPAGLVEGDHRRRRRRPELRTGPDRQGQAGVRAAGADQAAGPHGVLRCGPDDRAGGLHKGVGTQRVFLGTAVPGDVPGNFHSALTQLQRSGHLLLLGVGQVLVRPAGQHHPHRQGPGRAAAPRGRVGRDRSGACRVRRARGASSLASTSCPETNADIPDHRRGPAGHPAPEGRPQARYRLAGEGVRATPPPSGVATANRTHRNTLVYLAADEARLEELDAATRDYLGWSHVLDNEADLDLTQNQKNQAAQRKAQADQTVASRLLQTFIWALVPAQPDPGAPFTLREVKVEGQSDSLAERVSKRLGNDGDLSTRQAAATIRLAINKVPQIWKDGHVTLGALWGLYTQYPYMPRLRDRTVLEDGIFDQPMIWAHDGFALAAGYDEGSGRYVGLWTPADNASPPVATDALLLVRPDVATKQIADTAPPMPRVKEVDDEPKPVEPKPEPGRRIVDFVYPKAKTRFFGAKTLNPDKIALDFKNIAEEVLAHLRAGDASVVVRIEIEATAPGGFGEAKIRTVSENAKTLKFDQAGFEES